MRKLASVRRIKQLSPIAGADRIETATVDGWQVVVKKGEFKEGELCVYFEIDSWIPHSLAPFLTSEGKEPRTYKGVEGQRLRTVKLRKQISQGLILPVPSKLQDHVTEGQDVTDAFGVVKWEPEEAEATPRNQGKRVWTAKSFPTHLFPKTDQDRIQNVFSQLPQDHTWEVTVKLDGSSCSIFRLDGQLRVCSRNLEIPIVKEDDGWWTRLWKRVLGRPVRYRNTGNQFVAMALQVDESIKEGYCYQGELCGPSIQNNYEQLSTNQFYVYDIVDMKTRTYLEPAERRFLVQTSNWLNHVPIIGTHQGLLESVADFLTLADSTPTMKHSKAEGVVFKSNNDPQVSFKAISNNYLLYKEEKGLE